MKRDEKWTHGLLAVHGLHPQLPVSLRQRLEGDGHVSVETTTRG